MAVAVNCKRAPVWCCVCVGVSSLLCCVIALPGRVAVHQQNVNPQVHVFEGVPGSGVPLGTLTTQGSVESVDVSPASSSNTTQGYLVAVAGLQEQENTGVDNGFTLLAHVSV